MPRTRKRPIPVEGTAAFRNIVLSACCSGELIMRSSTRSTRWPRDLAMASVIMLGQSTALPALGTAPLLTGSSAGRPSVGAVQPICHTSQQFVSIMCIVFTKRPDSSTQNQKKVVPIRVWFVWIRFVRSSRKGPTYYVEVYSRHSKCKKRGVSTGCVYFLKKLIYSIPPPSTLLL